MAALAMTARRGIPFGTRAVFTYGPLGFLTAWQRLFFTSTAIGCFVFMFAMAAAVYAVLIRAVRARSSLLIAVLVAFVAGSPLLWVWTSPAESLLSLGFVLSIAVLGNRTLHAPLTVWMTFGGLAAIGMLSKAGVGVGLLALAVITVAGAPRLERRGLAALGMAFAVVFAAGWFLTGNGFGNLIPYARGAIEEGSGYSSAMYATTAYNVSLPSRHYDWWFVALGCAGLAVAAYRVAASPHARREGVGRRTVVAIAFATLLLAWILFKEGSVRHNAVVLFGSLPIMFAAFVPWTWQRRAQGLSGQSTIVVMLTSAFVAFAFGGGVPLQLLQPIGGLRGLANEAGTLLSPARRDRVINQARAAAQAAYGLSPSMVAATAGQTVAIDPYEQMVAWAYPKMRWDPIPVLQHYEAYTPALDKLDTDFLASSKAPRFIIRQFQTETVDTRVPVFDPPGTQVAIQCRYREAEVSGIWQLLERGPNRCHTRRQIAKVRAAYGQVVQVPAADPGTAIVAAFNLHLSWGWKLLNTFYKPPGVRIVLNGGPKANRFIALTAGEPHLLQAADTLGYTTTFTPPTVTSFMLKMDGRPSRGSRVDVTFFAVSVDAAQ
jgi:hypothetical protein